MEVFDSRIPLQKMQSPAKIREATLKRPHVEAVKIQGRQCHHKVSLLRKLADVTRASLYLEIGVHNGTSMSYVASAESMRRCVGVDLFEETAGHYVADALTKERSSRNIENNKHELCSVTLIRGHSGSPLVQEQVKNALGQNNGVDILFIDAGHSYDAAWRDFSLYSGLVKNGGLVVFDDYNISRHPGVVKAANRALALPSSHLVGVFHNNELVLQIRRSSLVVKKDISTTFFKASPQLLRARRIRNTFIKSLRKVR